MRILLNLPDPSPDWRKLADIISESYDLRDDVTLVVESDRIRFLDAEGREIRKDAPCCWSSRTIAQFTAKLSLLDWLHENFSSEKDPFHHQPARKNWLTLSDLTSEFDARGTHWAASRSTF